MPPTIDPLARFAKARTTYNYCGICGRRPKLSEEPNRAPLRWWDPDDGYKIGSLCRPCWEEVAEEKPKPSDYAYDAHRDDACSTDPETDEDPTEALDL